MTVDLSMELEINDKIVALVAKARRLFGIPEGCGGADACRALDFRLAREPIGRDGMLVESSRTITVNTSLTWPSRIEFTIYHEIFHRLLNDDEDGGDIIGFYTDALRNNEKAFRDAIEGCCQAGAAEFLLPRSVVRKAITNSGFSVDLIDSLALAQGSSILATTIQLALNAPMQCYVVVCSHGVSPRWPNAVGLHVEQAARRPDMKYPWSRGSEIPDNHIFARVWATKEFQSGPSKVVFPNGNVLPCEHSEAKMIGTRVAGILYRGHPQRKGQIAMDLGL